MHEWLTLCKREIFADALYVVQRVDMKDSKVSDLWYCIILEIPFHFFNKLNLLLIHQD